MNGEEASSDEEVFDAAKAAEQVFKLQKKTRKEIKRRFNTVDTDITTVQTEVKAVSDRQDELEKTVAALSRQVQDQQDKGQSDCARSVMSGMSSSLNGPNITKAMRDDCKPTYVQISGWSKGSGHIKTRGSELMHDEEAKAVMKFVIENSGVAKEHVDEKETDIENSNKPFGYARLRICFKKGTDSNILGFTSNDFHNDGH